MEWIGRVRYNACSSVGFVKFRSLLHHNGCLGLGS
jgi:hypothetical protein